jgi:hypothetical protein
MFQRAVKTSLSSSSATRRPLLGMGLPKGSPLQQVLRFPHPTASCDLHQIIGPPHRGLLMDRRLVAIAESFHLNSHWLVLQCVLLIATSAE